MEQIKRIKNAVVKIICGTTTGSGFYLAELGVVLTNFHVVAGERQVAVQLMGTSHQADQLDNLLMEKFGCPPPLQAP